MQLHRVRNSDPPWLRNQAKIRSASWDAELRAALIILLRMYPKWTTYQHVGAKMGKSDAACPHRRASELNQLGLLEVCSYCKGRTKTNSPCALVRVRADVYEEFKYMMDET